MIHQKYERTTSSAKSLTSTQKDQEKGNGWFFLLIFSMVLIPLMAEAYYFAQPAHPQTLQKLTANQRVALQSIKKSRAEKKQECRDKIVAGQIIQNKTDNCKDLLYYTNGDVKIAFNTPAYAPLPLNDPEIIRQQQDEVLKNAKN